MRPTNISPGLRPLTLTLITLLAFGLRIQRLMWQPLWWDEGYSVFFATEPLAQMLSLTALDIHPPVYYAALHYWSAFLRDSGLATVRLFSAGAGVVAVPLIASLAFRLGNGRYLAALAAALLLALNPMHIYYSQEVRMYSLAASLGLASSVAIVAWTQGILMARRAWPSLLLYVVLTLLLIHTLYYAAILIAIQLIWCAWMLRRKPEALVKLALGVAAVLFLSLPWTIYALPKLIVYVANKVQSDQDMPLGVAQYLFRHVYAYAAGHTFPVQRFSAIVLSAALIPLLSLLFVPYRTPSAGSGATLPWRLRDSLLFLVGAIAGSLSVGYLINLSYPFFPAEGERLLLFVLPYFLTLLALGLALCSLPALAKVAVATPLLAVSLLSIVGFYTQPRHTDLDYREIVRLVEERGSDRDTVLALFPWQVGYWRAYGRRDADGQRYLPQPEPVGQEILEWTPDLGAALDSAMEDGVVWFPEPLSLGSTLPAQIEAHLERTATNVENRWLTPRTRLTAWTGPGPDATLHPVSVDLGTRRLAGYTVEPRSIASDNSVIHVSLHWESAPAQEPEPLTVSLVDSEGRQWVKRVYNSPVTAEVAASLIDQFGLQVLVGLPVGNYGMLLDVVDDYAKFNTSSNAADDLSPHSVHLADVQVVLPTEPPEEIRVPLDSRAEVHNQKTEVKILGVAGIGDEPSAMAGSDLSVQVALRNTAAKPHRYDLALELVDQAGNIATEWQGWPLSYYPTDQWPPGAIVRVPVSLPLPAVIGPGMYRLTASLAQQPGNVRAPALDLATVAISSRQGNYEPDPGILKPWEPPQFGTHALLHGYETEVSSDGIRLYLQWEALQPLRPQHHIFVHLVDKDGTILAQQDGVPETRDGPAPTGGWRNGEYIVTEHYIPVPSDALSNLNDGRLSLQVGLYEPQTGVRLPVFIGDSPNGDSVTVPLAP